MKKITYRKIISLLLVAVLLAGVQPAELASGQTGQAEQTKSTVGVSEATMTAEESLAAETSMTAEESLTTEISLSAETSLATERLAAASEEYTYAYDEYGFYTDPDTDTIYYQPASWAEGDGRYEISNAGQLYWFAALVNGDTTQEGVTEAVPGADAVLTADIDLNPAYTFTSDGYTYDEEKEIRENPPVDTTSVITVHFQNTEKWSEVYTYYGPYDDGGWYESYTGVWPGIPVDASEDNEGWYTVTVASDVYYIIFNDNNNGNQTCDIELYSGVTEYWISYEDYPQSGYVSVDASTEQPEDWVEEEPWRNVLPDEWTPVGSSENVYSGIFDGGGHTVSGLYISTSESYQGLFGYMSGTVQNVKVENSSVYGENYTGSIAGQNDGGTISGCSNSGTVSGNKYAGGVIGDNDSGTVSDCNNSGTVSGAYYTGGIAGKNTGTMSGCSNSGAVSGDDYTGGIVAGNDSGKVSDCSNSGAVNGTYVAGGIAGLNDGTISACTNDGAANGTTVIGGIVGANDGTIEKCFNAGKVSSSISGAAGIVAYMGSGTVSGCINSQAIEGRSDVGGIVGAFAGGYAIACGNCGTVSGTSCLGGIAGYAKEASFTFQCYNAGEVASTTGDSYIGSIAGYAYSTSITDCYYLDTSADSGLGVYNNMTDTTVAKTSDEFASGEVAWFLNGGSLDEEGAVAAEAVTDGTQYWYQNLDNGEIADETPMPDSTHGTVYRKVSCAGAVAYSNNADSSVVHTYDENGFCIYCGAYEPASDSNGDGYYEIENPGQLFWFAALVNGTTSLETEIDGVATTVELEGITGAVSNANAVLRADIDLSVETETHTDVEWTPIGDNRNGNTTDPGIYYRGTFDGSGYTISNLYICDTESGCQGLFGYVSRGTVKNLTLKNVDITANSYIGALGGTFYMCTITNVRIDSGTITGSGNDVAGIGGQIRTGSKVSNCYNAAAVKTDGTIVGGIAGDLRNSATITNCYNVGSVSGAGNMGGIAGYVSTGTSTITNCYSAGELTVGSSGNRGGIVGLMTTSGAHNITNCYYLSGTADSGIASGGTEEQVTTAATAAEFASGEIAWLLQNAQDNTDTLVWGQTITGKDADAFPVLTEDIARKVLRIGFSLVTQNADSTWSLKTLEACFLNYNTALDFWPTPEDEEDTYVFYTDENLTCQVSEDLVFTADTELYAKLVVPEYVSVTITWGTLEFTYTDDEKVWNPETHTYDTVTEGGWTADDADGAKITVENVGTVSVTVGYTFAPNQENTALADLDGIFAADSEGTTRGETEQTLENGESAAVWLVLSGAPTEELSGAVIGSVTVTIAADGGGSE